MTSSRLLILLPITAGHEDERQLAVGALRAMPRLADPSAVRLHLVSVVDPPVDHDHADFSGDIESGLSTRRMESLRAATALHDHVREHAPEGMEVTSDLVYGEGRSVPQLLCDAAEEVKADVIAIPSHNRRGAERLLLGSVAERVLRDSGRSVLVLKPDLG
jgi:nucleotide-binding universal stress UspA family protein